MPSIYIIHVHVERHIMSLIYLQARKWTLNQMYVFYTKPKLDKFIRDQHHLQTKYMLIMKSIYIKHGIIRLTNRVKH